MSCFHSYPHLAFVHKLDLSTKHQLFVCKPLVLIAQKNEAENFMNDLGLPNCFQRKITKQLKKAVDDELRDISYKKVWQHIKNEKFECKEYLIKLPLICSSTNILWLWMSKLTLKEILKRLYVDVNVNAKTKVAKPTCYGEPNMKIWGRT